MDKNNIQIQRETWIKAEAAFRAAGKRYDDGVQRLGEEVERARSRVDAERRKLADMVTEAQKAAGDFQIPPSDDELKRAAVAIGEAEKPADGGKPDPSSDDLRASQETAQRAICSHDGPMYDEGEKGHRCAKCGALGILEYTPSADPLGAPVFWKFTPNQAAA